MRPLLALLALTACSNDYATKEDVARLAQRVSTLEAAAAKGGTATDGRAEGTGMAGMNGQPGREGGMGTPGQPGGEGGTGAPGGEGELAKTFADALDAMNAGDVATAKASLEKVAAAGTDPEASSAAKELLGELEMVGATAPPLKVSEWVQGQASVTDGKAVLLVFFDVAGNPKMDTLVTTAETWKGKGLTVAGIARPGPTSSKQQLTEWLSARKIGFPVALDDGNATREGYKRGTRPSGVLVKGGKIVWSGAPGMLSDQLLETSLR
ncbi:MAG: hypothetical protein ACK4YP_00225 [Myxococcota bacterium]